MKIQGSTKQKLTCISPPPTSSHIVRFKSYSVNVVHIITCVPIKWFDTKSRIVIRNANITRKNHKFVIRNADIIWKNYEFVIRNAEIIWTNHEIVKRKNSLHFSNDISNICMFKKKTQQKLSIYRRDRCDSKSAPRMS